MRRLASALGVFVLAVSAAGCDLTEVDLVDIADVVVAEAFVTIADVPGDNSFRALIHGNLPGAPPSSATYDDALVTVTDDDGAESVLSLSVIDECIVSRPENSGGSCFSADFVLASSFQAGDSLGLRVELSDGRVLTGLVGIPEAFQVNGIGASCRIPPDTLVRFVWARSSGAWAYLSEALITGLPSALAPEGIAAPDSLYLLGLSISGSDTTVVFPSEFGVFDRFDLDYDLAVRLQEGLPDGAAADVAITAVERNYVNWVRGGSFNPSGQVRVSSLVGDGSGVLAAAVTRHFTVVSTTDPTAGPRCPTG